MKPHPIALLSLLLSLYIYLVYRTDATNINQILNTESIQTIQIIRTQSMPLPSWIIYSLPEGLWLFATTLYSKKLYFDWNKHKISLVYFPILFAFTVEFFQATHITNGSFDLMDLLVSLFCWSIALILPTPYSSLNVFKQYHYRTIIVIFCYAIVYLSDVTNI